MADVAARLYGPTVLGTGAVTIYTSPGATTTIVRHIIACNTGTGTIGAKFTLSIGADAAGTRIVPSVLISPTDTFQLKGFIVLATGEILQAYSDTANSIVLTINGVKVT